MDWEHNKIKLIGSGINKIVYSYKYFTFFVTVHFFMPLNSF